MSIVPETPFPSPSHSAIGPVVARATLQVRGEFTFLVRAPPRTAVDLFGAHGERVWASHWDPRFLDPVPEQDRPGAVFLFNPQGEQPVLGYMPIFDRERGHVRHVFVRGSDSVTTIDVRLHPADGGATRAVVTYERTALHPVAEQGVRALAAEDGAQAAEWEAAIDAHLASVGGRAP